MPREILFDPTAADCGSRDFNEAVLRAELVFDFVRSSGAGGQNINKRATQAQLRWNVDKSSLFSDEEKARIKRRLANRINKAGELVLSRKTERSQLQNRENVIKGLIQLLREALEPVVPRIATKKPRPVRASEKEEKRRHSALKKQRGKKFFEG